MICSLALKRQISDVKSQNARDESVDVRRTQTPRVISSQVFVVQLFSNSTELLNIVQRDTPPQDLHFKHCLLLYTLFPEENGFSSAFFTLKNGNSCCVLTKNALHSTSCGLAGQIMYCRTRTRIQIEKYITITFIKFTKINAYRFSTKAKCNMLF